MIKVGIIGTGIIGREHAAAIAMTGGRMKLVAAADVSAERAAEFCKSYSVETRHAGAAELIADPQVQLVVVATPPSSHEPLAVAALDAGKYVLCEKPLAHSLASAQRIVEAEARHPGRLSVGFQLRYYAPFRRLIWLVRQGWLGELKFGTLDRHGAIPHTEHGSSGWWGAWDVAGGGVLITQMIHEIDLLIQLMGMPRSVKASADTRFTTIQSEDFLQAVLTFDNGRSVWCSGSVNSGTGAGGFILHGDKGEASLTGRLNLFDESRRKEALAAADKAVPVPAAPGRIGAALGQVARLLGSKPKPVPNAHTSFYLDIADAIERGTPLPISAKDGLASLELCTAIYESAITGEEITLPLSTASRIYNGVRIEDYKARKCDRHVPGLYLPAPPMTPPDDVIGKLKQAVKRWLTAVGLEPPVIKAMIRRPSPVYGASRTRIRSWPRRRAIGLTEKRAVMRLLDREIRDGEALQYNGDEEQAYCTAFANYLGGGYADAVNAGTSAVYIALKALDLEPGSEVICAPITDAGGTMPVAVMNCIPIVADAAPGSILASVNEIEAVLTERTSAIMVAHIAGHPADLDPILALAAKHGLPVIEDCAQAHGTFYKGRMVGTFGDIAAFSTMYLKNHITGGQGGVVFTRNPRLFVRARQIADRGKAFGVLRSQGNVIASLNLNQDEISMAIGREQLKKLPAQVSGRRAFAAMIDAGLRGVEEVSLIGDPSYGLSSFHFLMLRVDVDRLGCTIEELVDGLNEDGIAGAALYKVYPTDGAWYRNAAVFGTSGMPWSLRQITAPPQFELPNAREATRTLLRIDLHNSLGPREAKDVVTAIRKAVRWYRDRARRKLAAE